MQQRINVTKAFLPPVEEYQSYVNKIWANGQLTNQGSLLRQLEDEIKKFLDVEDFHFVTNGTVALQVALRSFGFKDGEIITTPFSYVATSSAILWEQFAPVFVDIDPDTLCIDPNKIEAAITDKTKAILAVHVFGNPCDIKNIESIANKHNLKTIYDGAHAFGVSYNGKSLLDYGDISMTSFHATKLFHTIEGGGLVFRDKSLSDKADLIKRFGHHGDEHLMLGINAKATEFQAAMGLCNLTYIDQIIDSRKKIFELYNKFLGNVFNKPKIRENTKYNYSYYPVIFKDKQSLENARSNLEKNNIFPRRYFYPSLNKLPYLNSKHHCPISEDIAERILCLPLFVGLEKSTIRKISDLVLA